MNDVTWIVTSVFGGCMMGMFMLGFFTARVDYGSLMIALVFAILLNVYLGLNAAGWLPAAITLDVHAYWVGILVNLFFIALAYGLSLIRARPQPSLAGLTVWTIGERQGS